ncbi:MAG: hypothetical protein NZ908_02175 [Candidatus Micrarchaeota archaeon]|nr:hypothetical protein [Candidatus Micrarchaeota archaeon]MCX8154794.1 hypothetical protein [Candidatus Micrarchaeota archaeon]
MDLDLKLREPGLEQKSETFERFMEKYANQIEEIRKNAEQQYNTELSKQGIQEILLLLWLIEDSDVKVLEKFRTLLNKLFKKGIIESLKRFLMPERNYKKRKR